MKMPEKTETAMFAPCGMNCLVCTNTVTIRGHVQAVIRVIWESRNIAGSVKSKTVQKSGNSPIVLNVLLTHAGR